jgi:hypothetical protein
MEIQFSLKRLIMITNKFFTHANSTATGDNYRVCAKEKVKKEQKTKHTLNNHNKTLSTQ